MVDASTVECKLTKIGGPLDAPAFCFQLSRERLYAMLVNSLSFGGPLDALSICTTEPCRCADEQTQRCLMQLISELVIRANSFNASCPHENNFCLNYRIKLATATVHVQLKNKEFQMALNARCPFTRQDLREKLRNDLPPSADARANACLKPNCPARP